MDVQRATTFGNQRHQSSLQCDAQNPTDTPVLPTRNLPDKPFQVRVGRELALGILHKTY